MTMTERQRPFARYRALRDSTVVKVVDAVFPLFPMAPMPLEGRRSPSSSTASGYLAQIEESNRYHAFAAASKVILALGSAAFALVTSGAVDVQTSGAAQAVLFLAVLGAPNALRIGVNTLRQGHYIKKIQF